MHLILQVHAATGFPLAHGSCAGAVKALALAMGPVGGGSRSQDQPGACQGVRAPCLRGKSLGSAGTVWVSPAWGKPCCLPRGHHHLGNFLLQALGSRGLCSSKGMRTPRLFLKFRAPEHRDGTTCLCVHIGIQSFAGMVFWHRFFSPSAPCQPTGHSSWLLLAAV